MREKLWILVAIVLWAAIFYWIGASVASIASAEVSTGYCLNGRMADGTNTRSGSVAHNGYPLGARLWISPSPTGRHRFVVRDRIGYGTELDFWLPSCASARSWGRRVVRARVGWPHLVSRARVVRLGLGYRP